MSYMKDLILKLEDRAYDQLSLAELRYCLESGRPHLPTEEHLQLSEAGIVWIDGYAGPDDTYLLRPVGALEDAEWPSDLGPEPPWFRAELDLIRAEVREAREFGAACRDEASQAYLGGIGAR